MVRAGESLDELEAKRVDEEQRTRCTRPGRNANGEPFTGSSYLVTSSRPLSKERGSRLEFIPAFWGTTPVRVMAGAVYSAYGRLSRIGLGSMS